ELEDPRRSPGIVLLAHVDGEALEEPREPAPGFGPRHLHLTDGMVRALDPGRPGVDPGLELHGVEMAPEPLLFVVVGGELLPALRARPEGAVAVFKIDIDALLGNVQLDTTHMPGRFQTEETPVKTRILHAAHRRAGAPPTPSA